MQLDCGLQALGGHMGTYTTNYNLFMPSIGEQGWGDLVNGNFTTIDTTMKGLSNRITAVENEVNGALNCTSVTTSGTITSAGKITANDGIAGALTGNVTGNVTGFHFVKGTIGTNGDVTYASCPAISITGTTDVSSSAPGSFYVGGYSVSFGNPHRHTWGVYTRRSDLSGTAPSNPTTRTFTIRNTTSYAFNFYYKVSSASSYSKAYVGGSSSTTVNLNVGYTYNWYSHISSYGNMSHITVISAPALTTYYVKYATP